MNIKKVCVIGLGYIGLPTAAVLASHGLTVIGVDVVQATVDATNAGKTLISEHELEPLVSRVVASGHLHASLEPEAANVFIIAVPTPFTEGHQPDISFVKAAATSIAPVLSAGNLVILESTSPVGTTELVADLLSELRPDLAKTEHGFHAAYCPERVLPGRILKEIVENDRIVGGTTPLSSSLAATFYKIFVKGRCLTTTARTAELCKLAENSFRDVNIAFANELSIVADKLGVNPWELIELANHHPRVKILQPGPGVGGHCIAVDPWFIVHSSPDEARLIKTAREVNDSKPDWVVNKVESAARSFRDRNAGKSPTIGCLGLAFKANIDDLRESPSLRITEMLAERGIGKIIAAEPNVDALPPRAARLGVVLHQLEDVLSASDILLLLVDHNEFKGIKLPPNTVLIDTRGLLDKRQA